MASRLLRFNLLLLCGFGVLFAVDRVFHFFAEVFILLSVVLFALYLLMGPVAWLEQGVTRLCPWLPVGWRRGVAVLMVNSSVLVLLALLILGGLPSLNAQCQGLAQDLPGYVTRLAANVDHLLLTPPPTTALEASGGRSAVAGARGEAASPPSPSGLSQRLMASVLQSLPGWASTTMSRLIYGLTGGVVLFYLLLDGARLKSGFVGLLPPGSRGGVEGFLQQTHDLLRTLIQGQVVLALFAGGFLYGVYRLLGIDYAGVLAAVFAVASVLPVVGPWLGLLPSLVVVLFSPRPEDIQVVMVCMAVFFLLKEYWIAPRLVGRVLDIHPVVVILAFLLCVEVGGIAGVFMTFPLASVVSVAFRRFQKRQGNEMA